MALIDQIAKTAVEKRTIVWGEITATGPPLGVRVARDSVDIKVDLWLDSYTPVVNDKVALLKVGQQWVVLGKMVDA